MHNLHHYVKVMQDKNGLGKTSIQQFPHHQIIPSRHELRDHDDGIMLIVKLEPVW